MTIGTLVILFIRWKIEDMEKKLLPMQSHMIKLWLATRRFLIGCWTLKFIRTCRNCLQEHPLSIGPLVYIRKLFHIWFNNIWPYFDPYLTLVWTLWTTSKDDPSSGACFRWRRIPQFHRKWIWTPRMAWFSTKREPRILQGDTLTSVDLHITLFDRIFSMLAANSIWSMTIYFDTCFWTIGIVKWIFMNLKLDGSPLKMHT